MKRWWANSKDSIAALSVVDDSDVVNGVGVALLGYHGLSQEVLQPLTKETLVDIQRVRDALSEIDLEPVAKAFGEATKSVMGGASERYGQLLAGEVHRRAIAATERLLNTWTTNGMSWPQAIEKAAEVHGVPLERLGRYATVMKNVSITPHVRADYADRELMSYASDFGKRESIVDTALIEKQEKRREFNEQEHPRNPNGEFREKNAEVTQITDKLSRLDKLNRLNKLNSANRKNLAAIKASAVANKKENIEEQTIVSNLRLPNKRLENKRLPNKKLKNPRLGNVILPNNPGKPPTEEDFPDVITHRWSQDVFIPITKEIADEIRYIRKGEFFAGQIKNDDGTPLEAINSKFLPKWLELHYSDGKGGVNLAQFYEDNIQFVKSNETPIDFNTIEAERTVDDWNNDIDYACVAPRAKFSVKQGVLFETISSGDVKNKFNEDIMLDVIFAQLENGDYEKFYKSLNSNELEHFNEEHPRDQSGRFTDKQEIIDLNQVRADRLNKLNRLNKINNINAQRAAQMKNLINSQKEVHENVRLANKRLENPKLSNKRLENKRLDTRKFDSSLQPKNEIQPIDLDKAWAFTFGKNLLGNLEDPLNLKIALGLVNEPKPFYNYRLDPDNKDKETAFQSLLMDVDDYNSNHLLDRQYLRDSIGNRLKIYCEADDVTNAIQKLLDNPPMTNIPGQNIVWQPGIEITNDMRVGYEDDIIVHPYWEKQPIEDDANIILGSKQELEALKNGHATIVKREDFESMFDLLSNSIIEGEEQDSEWIWDTLFAEGKFNNVGTNPPVSVYTVKMSKGN